MGNEWFPPEEESVVERAQRIHKAIEVARREMEEGEYWIDISGKIWHVADMESNHLHKVLDMLWRRCVQVAHREWSREKEVIIDKVIRHLFDRYDFEEERPIDAIELEEHIKMSMPNAADIWQSQAFVQRALQVLRIRDYAYTKPWERELPF